MNLPGNWNLTELLALSYIKGLSFNTIRKIAEKFSSLNELKHSNYVDLSQTRIFQRDIFDDNFSAALDSANQQLDLCFKNEISIVTLWDEIYPSLLKQITGPPVILFLKGNLNSADSISISIVGTRKNTLYGKLTTERYAEYFSKNSIIVTSGLANGIDSIAHETVIKSGGITYAVVASGLDCIKTGSSFQEKFANRIIESGGAVLSEYKCGTRAIPTFFPQRNRIISGISIATLVVESAAKGGSLLTARFAFDQNREVFAVPGNITSERSEGTNRLILKDSAKITVAPEDILYSLGIKANPTLFEPKTEIKLSAEENRIFEHISFEPIHIDALADKSQCEISELLVKLLGFEFRGLVRQLPGKYYIKN